MLNLPSLMFNYGKNFWVLCWSMFFFMTSFNLIIPELNGFLKNLGGQEYQSLIIALFTISACISRPFSGKLADKIGRKKVMYIGMFISVFTSLIYPFSTSFSFAVLFFLGLRFLHGFSAGFFPTGATALITDILPDNQRGKGMGVWGMFISLGIGVGQGFGSFINNSFGTNCLFLFASAIAIISGLLIFRVKESLKNAQPFKPEFLSVKLNEIVEPAVLPAAIVMFLSATCSGIIFVTSPDICDFLKIETKGWFFICYVLTTLIVRFFCGSLSDIIGRRKTLLIGMFFLIISMFLIGYSHDILSYSIGSIIFGIATGISSPTLFAWTADLSRIEHRGLGSGTMFIALELGIMFGSLSTIFTYNHQLASIPFVFSIGAFLAFTAFLYLIWHLLKRKSLT